MCVTGSWFLENNITVEFFKCIFWAPQLAPFSPVILERRQNSLRLISPKVSRWINSITGKKKNMYFWILGWSVPVIFCFCLSSVLNVIGKLLQFYREIKVENGLCLDLPYCCTLWMGKRPLCARLSRLTVSQVWHQLFSICYSWREAVPNN